MKKIIHKVKVPDVARELLALCIPSAEHATVVALSGDLGAGKTTLTQEIARELGVTGTVISPTFVIMKSYDLPRAECARGFRTLVHIDAYRLDSHEELLKLAWQELLMNPGNLILVEWPEKVSKIIPKYAHKVSLLHKSEDEREISIS